MNLPPGGNLVSEARKPGNVILLARGGNYTGVLSPVSGVTVAVQPGDGPAPILNGRVEMAGVHDVALDGFVVKPTSKGSVKGVQVYHCQRVKLLNLSVAGFGWMGVTVQGLAGQRSTDVTLRGCLVADNFPADGSKHSAGLYAQFTDGLTIDGNVFSSNGGAPGGETIYNQNVYIHGSNGPAVFTNNVSHNASSHGVQMRSGGICKGNLFLDNPIHQSYGLVNGEACFPGGVSGDISSNIYIGGGSIGASPRNWGVELANLKNVSMSRCLFAHDPNAGEAAIALKMPSGLTNPSAMLPASQWKLSLSAIYVWDYGKPALSVASGIAKPTMGANVGVKPPTAADLRAVLGVGFGPWAKLNPSAAAPAAVAKCFAKAGV